MKIKLIVSAAVFLAVALFPFNSITKSEASAASNSTVLSSDNVLVLNGEVTGESTSEIITKARALDASLNNLQERYSGKRPLFLFIFSPGGSIQAGLELIEALKGLGRPVNTVTMFSASMAFQIAQNLDDRLILKNGALMSHHARGEFGGDFGGVTTQADSRLKFWKDRVQELDEQTVKRTNGKQTYESYTKEYDHEMWLTGTKSVDEGYADRVVTVKCDPSLNGFDTHHINFMGFLIEYDLDKCPLNTTPMNVRLASPGDRKMASADMDQLKANFLSKYELKQRQVIPMYW